LVRLILGAAFWIPEWTQTETSPQGFLQVFIGALRIHRGLAELRCGGLSFIGGVGG